MPKKSISDLMVDLRIVEVINGTTDQGNVVVVYFDSKTSPILSGVIDLPALVAAEYDLEISHG